MSVPTQSNRGSPPAARVPPATGEARKPEGPGKLNIPRRTWLAFLIILALNYVVMNFLFPGPDAPVTVPYTTFKEQVAKRNVKAIYSQGTSIEGRFVAPVTWPPDAGHEAAPGAKRGATLKPRTA